MLMQTPTAGMQMSLHQLFLHMLFCLLWLIDRMVSPLQSICLMGSLCLAHMVRHISIADCPASLYAILGGSAGKYGSSYLCQIYFTPNSVVVQLG